MPRASSSFAVLAALLAMPAAVPAGARDADGDGLANRFERHTSHTNPRRADTDRDRLSDAFEVRRSKTSPRRRDTDRDGLSDAFEVRRSKTSPRRRDTDRDGVADRVELIAGTDPLRRPAASRGLVAGDPLGSALAPVPAAETPIPDDCDRNATPATFASALSAASAGQTICLASGDYGTWRGTSKAVTIRPRGGASPTMSLDLSGSSDGNFTIDGGRSAFSAATGLTIEGADITGAVHDVTIENSRFTGGVKFVSHPHPNVVLDHNEHVGIPAGDTAAIHLPGGADVHSGVTVENSLFRDMEADGVQTGPAIDILHNEFARMGLGGSAAHTDMIQLYCGCGDPGVGSLVKGNYIHDGEQGIGAFDGAGSSRIEDNVIADMNVHHLVLGGDVPGSVVRHNTIAGSGNLRRIDCSSKSGFPASRTFIRDNIAPQGVQLVGGVNCQPSENRNNMRTSGASAPNLNGTAQFAGGPNPTTYEGYRLAPGSPGKGAASDGLDVGIR